MLLGLYIFIDDDFDDPVYGDPSPGDQDETLWEIACEAVNDALEEEGTVHGVRNSGESRVAWNVHARQGISFVAMVSDDVKASEVEKFLANLARRYMDEVDDPRNPERHGVEDVVVDVIPPWEEEDED